MRLHEVFHINWVWVPPWAGQDHPDGRKMLPALGPNV